MSQADFAYATPANDGAGLPLSLSIFADRLELRATMHDDAEAAGFHVFETASVASLLEGDARPLGQVVLVDCPRVDGEALAGLSRLDMRAAHCGAQMIVSTHIDVLDDVFACLDQSNPQLLVNPSRAERVIALGRALAVYPQLRLRELAEEDRLVLLRLTEQVGQIADRLERMKPGANGHGEADGSAFRFESPNPGFVALHNESSDRLSPAGRPSLPEPRLVRRIIRQRQLRARFFDSELFADPAWDMLLDLTAARTEHVRVSVTSLCIASGVPPTTALRWINQMIEVGLFERIEDDSDKRRAFIALTNKGADAMARYFADIGRSTSRLG